MQNEDSKKDVDRKKDVREISDMPNEREKKLAASHVVSAGEFSKIKKIIFRLLKVPTIKK